MLKKIYLELLAIKTKLQAIRISLELRREDEDKKSKMSETEITYRSFTEAERQAVNWALSLENDSEALNTIKKLSLSKTSHKRM